MARNSTFALKELPILLFISAILLCSCNAAKHSYQSGNFDKAVEQSVKKLKSNPRDEEAMKYLEASYAKLYRKSMDQVIFLKKEGRPENVLPVYQEMSALRFYEQMIQPLLPLYMVSKRRNATFNFIKDEDLITAKQNAAEYLYVYAGKLLEEDDHLQARKAYHLYMQLVDIYPEYKDAAAKREEALLKGTNNVYLQMVNNSGAYLFQELEKQITAMPLRDLDAEWVNFYGPGNNHPSFDYNITVNIRQIIVTPDMQQVPAIRTESKSIQDGWNYALDSKGNVKKDSLGNDIKTPKYKIIQCTITEYLQEKSSTIGGTLDFYNAGHSLIYSSPFTSSQLFQNSWATANGDLNALTKESAIKIKSSPAPYPTEIDMLLQAGENLKSQMRSVIRDKMELVRD